MTLGRQGNALGLRERGMHWDPKQEEIGQGVSNWGIKGIPVVNKNYLVEQLNRPQEYPGS